MCTVGARAQVRSWRVLEKVERSSLKQRLWSTQRVMLPKPVRMKKVSLLPSSVDRASCEGAMKS